MYRVVRGGRDKVFQFVRQPTLGHRVLILAQYCIANESESRIGSTEREILKGIQDNGYYEDEKVAWIDLVQLSSNTTNSVIDQNIILEISRNEDLVTDYI
jgi:hypothetical protein